MLQLSIKKGSVEKKQIKKECKEIISCGIRQTTYSAPDKDGVKKMQTTTVVP